MIGNRYTFSRSLLPTTLSVILFCFSSGADVSPLCNDLARFACAPGGYKDGTGEIKSESEIQKFMAAYSDKSHAILHDRFSKILSDPANSYFKDVSVAALGLKNSPQCNSQAPSDAQACRDDVVDGLTTIAQKQALGPLMPRTGLGRSGNLKELDYIIQNNTYQKVILQLNNQVQKDLENPEMTKKIQEKVFPQIKQLLLDRISKLSIPEVQKKFMMGKVSSITFEGTSCENFDGGFRKNNELISSLLVPNAFYDSAANTFKLCSGLLIQSTSEFEIAQVIGHELSHSIDPCSLALGPTDLGFKYSQTQDLKKMEEEYPIKNVLHCLRDSRSIAAKNSSYDQGSGSCPMCSQTYGGVYGSKSPGPGGFNNNLNTNAPGQPPKKQTFCEGDQITESFADWMSYEILPQYIERNYKLTVDQYRNGYANARRLSCKITEEDGGYMGDPHPSTEGRINKLLLVNPKIRVQMGCPEKHPENLYCDSEKATFSSTEQNNNSQPHNPLPIRDVR
jgi:hypothetical protein